MHERRFLRALVTLLLVVALFSQGTWVLAGTTGSISGTVIDKSTNAPLPNVKVTASSPSQVSSALTNAVGHFSLLSLAPDTYSVTVEKAGFSSTVQNGVTVLADQNQTISLQTSPELKTIGRTVSRSAGSLVKNGVTSDVYSVNPTQQAAAAPLGGGNNLNSAYSAISSMPGTLVPLSTDGGWGQSINIRGGDYTQTGNEIDGIPINRAFDQYAGSPLSNLGNAEIQVYTGNQPADAQANGLAGFVNQVIRTGTYPGFSYADAGIGGPAYYHKFSIETGGATPESELQLLCRISRLQPTQPVRRSVQRRRLYVGLRNDDQLIASGCGTPHPSVGCYLNGPNANPLDSARSRLGRTAT